MADTTKTYTITDAEFATLLEAAASEGVPLRLKADDTTYLVQVASERSDFWTNYNPERVRAALRANAAIPDRVDPRGADEILREIKAQRGQDSRGRPANS